MTIPDEVIPILFMVVPLRSWSITLFFLQMVEHAVLRLDAWALDSYDLSCASDTWSLFEAIPNRV